MQNTNIFSHFLVSNVQSEVVTDLFIISNSFTLCDSALGNTGRTNLRILGNKQLKSCETIILLQEVCAILSALLYDSLYLLHTSIR